MKRMLQRFVGVRRAQTTVEYGIIVALIAIASISIIMIFGDQLRALFSAESQQLSGDQNAQNQDMSSGADQEVTKSLSDL